MIDAFVSPLTDRYGTAEMRSIWSEKHKRELWRLAWSQLLYQQTEDGRLVFPRGALPEDSVIYPSLLTVTEESIAASKKLEAILEHDLVAELAIFKENLPEEQRNYLHAGYTSSDIEDMADAKRITESLYLIFKQTASLVAALGTFCKEQSMTRIIGRTHLQKAEPTTLGWRFMVYLQELSRAGLALAQSPVVKALSHREPAGAVGTYANQYMLLDINHPDSEDDGLITNFEALITGQTYPRSLDFEVGKLLDAVSLVLIKMHQDIRLQQSYDELTESTGSLRVGSSAMPGKKNPIKSEKICGIGRVVHANANALWDMASSQMLERSLDDSSLRRIVLPEMFISLSEMLKISTEVISSIQVHPSKLNANTEWRSWLPSRVLALVRSRGGSMGHTELERMADLAKSPSEFLSMCKIKLLDLHQDSAHQAVDLFTTKINKSGLLEGMYLGHIPGKILSQVTEIERRWSGICMQLSLVMI